MKEITLTKAAVLQVNKFKEGQGLDDVPTFLRLGVKGGGCSGYIHQLALDAQKEDDLTFETNNCKVIVDPESYELVKGSEIDYVEGLMGAGFQVNNPNAAGSCGCGSSFVVKEGDGCEVA